LASVYLIPRADDYYYFSVYADSLVAIIYFLIFITNYQVKNGKFNFEYLLLLFSILLLPFGSKIFNVHWVYIFLFSIISFSKITISKNIQYLSAFFLLIAITSQLLTYSSYDGRPTLSFGDPNYTAYYLTILFFLFQSFGIRRFCYIFLLLATLSISRVFFLSVIIYFILNILINFKITKSINFLVKISPFVVVFGPIIYIFFYFSFIGDPAINYQSGYDRLLNINDKSNSDRAFANFHYIEYLIENPLHIITGVDFNSYVSDIFYNTPHNSFMATSFNYGILYFLAVLSIFCKTYIFSRKTDSIKIFILSLLPWMVFLGGSFFGPQLLILGFIIKNFNCNENN